MEKVLSTDLRRYCDAVQEFHGALSPGMVIGWFMVKIARNRLPEGTLFDVICETGQCLPDSVQLLTPCSVGNRWLRVIDVGRFAVTFFDKGTGKGFRVHLDSVKIESWPCIREWFLKLKPKRDQDRARLLAEISAAQDSILTVTPLVVAAYFLRGGPEKTLAICPVCHEAYRAEDGPCCPACEGVTLPYCHAGGESELVTSAVTRGEL